jgi:hypothetical protein
MKTIARQIEIRRFERQIQMRQDIRDPAELVGPDLTRVVIFKESPEAAMPKGPDHQDTVSCSGTRVNASKQDAPKGAPSSCLRTRLNSRR